MRSMLIKWSALACGLALSLAACNGTPPKTPPATPADDGYTPGGTPPTIPSVGKAGVDQHFALGQEVSGEWWGLFQSPPLDAAHQAVLVAAGGFYPQVDFGASSERQRNNFKAFGISGFPPREFNAYIF